MSMIGDAAREGCIEIICKLIDEKIAANKRNRGLVSVLKELRREIEEWLLCGLQPLESSSRPLLAWDSKVERHPKLVWRSKLDNRYLIEVQRIDCYRGKLCVFDHKKDDKEVFSQEVSLSYEARFGPDVDDVREWQEKVLDFIDNIYNKK